LTASAVTAVPFQQIVKLMLATNSDRFVFMSGIDSAILALF